MNVLDALQADLAVIAERSAAIKAACLNEESTKQYLVLPVIGALGYDYTDPFEVQPEYAADFRDGVPDRADYVILRGDDPVIAIECKKVGTDLSIHRGQLRGYFTALQSVSLGILTDGLHFEFFVDSENANIMDQEPFVTLDLEAAARGPVPAEVLDALSKISRANFQPHAISETAESMLVAKRVRTALMEEIREPSDEFCRFILQRVGVKNVRRTSIQAQYSALVRASFEEALVLPVLDALRASATPTIPTASDESTTRRIITTDRELAVYRYVCRRLAYIATDEHQFSAIEGVRYRDYLGKFAVYFESIRKGRLFDFIEGENGYDKFIFPEPFGEIVTNVMTAIDEPLRATFTQRIRELAPDTRAGPQLQRA